MRARVLFYIILAASTFTNFTANGQIIVENGIASYDYGHHEPSICSGAVYDSVSRKPLPGALISIVSKWNEEIFVESKVTNEKGRFEFEFQPTHRNSRVEISHFGYKLLKVPFEFSFENTDLGRLYLAPDVTEIDAVTVKARMNMYRINGDTIVYFPRAVKTMEGDKASRYCARCREWS